MPELSDAKRIESAAELLRGACVDMQVAAGFCATDDLMVALNGTAVAQDSLVDVARELPSPSLLKFAEDMTVTEGGDDGDVDDSYDYVSV